MPLFDAPEVQARLVSPRQRLSAARPSGADSQNRYSAFFFLTRR
jgi:hypothetical protein